MQMAEAGKMKEKTGGGARVGRRLAGHDHVASEDKEPNTERGGRRRKAPRNKFEKKERGKPFKKREATGNRERNEIKELNELYETFDFNNWESFKEAPLSVKTKASLERCGYTKPTRIQKETLALALKGRDILGAAKTGSGKTLAFLIPVLELLFREMWTRMDGLGALIITPTRELAYQIFEVLKKVGARHDFSAGLIIGGTEVGFERNRIHGTNIIICTPGRLLQHMDQNPLLDPTNLKILAHRQTLLFSATQTKSVKDLARLSLDNPCYVSVHEKAAQITPDQLHQNYLVCELQDKLSLLWSFLKNHKSKKVIVFMSCCKQVQFVNTVIRRLRPGNTVLHLHGNMSQLRRLAIYDQFCSKRSAILLATDLAARGLDFPKVDWVMQLDCPEDPETYIHRVGRTARFENAGKALLVLLPSEEEAMIKRLEERKIPVSKIEVNPRRFHDIQRKVEAMCARDAELKASAQRCFVGYLKYVFMQKDKHVFCVEKLDLDLYSRSLGLIITPRARFLQKYFAARGIQMLSRRGPEPDQSSEEHTHNTADEAAQSEDPPKKTQLSKKIEKFAFDTGIDSDEEIFTKKGKPLLEDEAVNGGREVGDDDNMKPISTLESLEEQIRATKANKVITKVQAAKKILKKKNIVPNQKVVFDDAGHALDANGAAVVGKPLAGVEEKGGININLSKQLMREQDRIDKQIYREKIKSKHREERLRAKAERRAATTGTEVVLDVGRGGSSGDDTEEGSERHSEDQETSDDTDQGVESGSDDDVSGGRYSDAEQDSEDEEVGNSEKSESDGEGIHNEFRNGGRKRRIDDYDDQSGSNDVDSSYDEPLPAKHIPRKPMKTREKFGFKRRRVDNGDYELHTGLGLRGDEELALKLLQS
ncbi:putative ATP-dependent RNA helicase DDX10-like [Tropilaelaps mercedesae]|uniref:ATP-dependent RNA helicase n=1 Tax=Tropilaelaps mercedesae TaxID=418985 RepID=A0A1V9XN11_9ACAR|nr:putative ATP-dependent RNA helicase DDX10-like [Tropilaelaps mercedesae]